MASAEDLWSIFECGAVGDIRAMYHDDEVFTGHHPVSGLTALQLAAVELLYEPYYEERISCAFEFGADPYQLAASWCTVSWRLYANPDDEDDKKVLVRYAGMSAIGVVSQFLRDMRANEIQHIDKDWHRTFERLQRGLSLMSRAPRRKARTIVDSGVVDLWERFRGDTDSHDVTLVTAEGDVSAHRAVLAHASPVLRAMLASSMREGTQQRVEVKDTPKQSAVFFLDLLYAGTSTQDFDAPVALATLDLAHRWQVVAVMRMAEGALAGILTDANFASIAESAAIKCLEDLTSACKTFASDSKVVNYLLRAGRLPAPVLKLLRGRRVAEAPTAKIRRTF